MSLSSRVKRSISYLYSLTCAWYMFSSLAMAFICLVFSRRVACRWQGSIFQAAATLASWVVDCMCIDHVLSHKLACVWQDEAPVKDDHCHCTADVATTAGLMLKHSSIHCKKTAWAPPIMAGHTIK